jgi:NAD(P)-dependent dehydrogenase (short-subunit alcohol dehydrogenase family)
MSRVWTWPIAGPSPRSFVAAWEGPLHILVDNAGIMATPEQRTPEGWEMQFAVNHLGHFALTTGLHDALAAAGGARVVVVSSVGHVNGEVLFDDVNFERHPYNPWAAYSQSKTANVLFAVEAARRWTDDKITVNALNPGRIASTGLSRYIDTAAMPPQSFDPEGRTGVSVKDIPRARPPPCSSRHRLWSMGSRASTSRIAKRQRPSRLASAAASPPTPSIPARPPAYGSCPSTCSHRQDAPLRGHRRRERGVPSVGAPAAAKRPRPPSQGCASRKTN